MNAPLFKKNPMKKLYSSVILCAGILSLCSSCSSDNRGLKESLAVVKSMTDSTIVATIDGSDATLITTEARIPNGVYMPGDSVRLNYVGSLSSGEAKALLIYVLPQASKVVNAKFDGSKELKTAVHDDAKE